MAVLRWLLFVIGMVFGVVVGIYAFFYGLFAAKRAFHPRGTICEATVTALDTVVGPRLAGAAKVRLSGVSEPENSPEPTVIGFAMKFGDDQDLATASFESFFKLAAAKQQTDVANYLHNEFASVSPWRTNDLGVVWYRAIGSTTATTGTRVERLDADIAAGTAKIVLQARKAPGPTGDIICAVAEIALTKRLPDDDPTFHISMWRSGRGISATGFLNGIRSIAYPMSQAGRGLRGT